MLACQMSRAGLGPARNVGELEKGLALQAPKFVAEGYRGLYTGTQALLTVYKHGKLLLQALATGVLDEYDACVAGVKFQPNTLQIRRFA